MIILKKKRIGHPPVYVFMHSYWKATLSRERERFDEKPKKKSFLLFSILTAISARAYRLCERKPTINKNTKRNQWFWLLRNVRKAHIEKVEMKIFFASMKMVLRNKPIEKPLIVYVSRSVEISLTKSFIKVLVSFGRYF